MVLGVPARSRRSRLRDNARLNGGTPNLWQDDVDALHWASAAQLTDFPHKATAPTDRGTWENIRLAIAGTGHPQALALEGPGLPVGHAIIATGIVDNDGDRRVLVIDPNPRTKSGDAPLERDIAYSTRSGFADYENSGSDGPVTYTSVKHLGGGAAAAEYDKVGDAWDDLTNGALDAGFPPVRATDFNDLDLTIDWGDAVTTSNARFIKTLWIKYEEQGEWRRAASGTQVYSEAGEIIRSLVLTPNVPQTCLIVGEYDAGEDSTPWLGCVRFDVTYVPDDDDDDVLTVASPSFSHPDGTTFAETLDLSVTCATPGAMVYLTVTSTGGKQDYQGLDRCTVTLDGTVTVSAYAAKDGMQDSATISREYIFKPHEPDSIDITSPSTAVTWAGGEEYPITWNTVGNIGRIAVYLVKDDIELWVVKSVLNTGEVSVPVPQNRYGEGWRLKVCSTDRLPPICSEPSPPIKLVSVTPLPPVITAAYATGALVAGQNSTLDLSCTARDTDGTVDAVSADLSAVFDGAADVPLEAAPNDQWTLEYSGIPLAEGGFTATLTARDNDGNLGTGDVAIYVDPGPATLDVWTSADDDLVMQGTCTGLNGGVSGGSPPYTYAWNGSDGWTSTDKDPDVCPTHGTQYTLTVTDSGNPPQMGSSSVLVHVEAEPIEVLAALGTYDTNSARALAVDGHTAYVADAGGGFISLDITDLSTPTWLDATIHVNSAAGQVDIADGRAYIANSDLCIVDVTNPANLLYLGAYAPPAPASSTVWKRLARLPMSVGVAGRSSMRRILPTAPG